MTTEELFREDATLAQCEARVVAVGEGGVILDRTVFYPLGGGQAGDTGVLRLADGQELLVTDTRKSKEHAGGVLHVLAPDAVLVVGDVVVARIDVARRNAHRRFHTTTHLLCALVPHPVDGCSITAGYEWREGQALVRSQYCSLRPETAAADEVLEAPAPGVGSRWARWSAACDRAMRRASFGA